MSIIVLKMQQRPQRDPQQDNLRCPVLNLCDYPPEIRGMIFEHVITEWDGKTPALIVALRGQPEQTMYLEALQVLFKKCTFVFSGENEARLYEMSEQTVAQIQHYCVRFG